MTINTTSIPALIHAAQYVHQVTGRDTATVWKAILNEDYDDAGEILASIFDPSREFGAQETVAFLAPQEHPSNKATP